MAKWYGTSKIFATSFLVLLATNAWGSTGTLPLWEAGIGTGWINLPHYRGSDQRNSFVLPLPYLIYRGEYFHSDREGIRSILLNTERIALNISLNGSLPANSSDNVARRGMPSLKPTVEIGPTLALRLWQTADRKTRFGIQAPIRTAVTVESSPRQIGWLFSPNLNLSVTDPAGFIGWNIRAAAGPLFADRRYHRYFYSVANDEATLDRPAYSAPGGYAGSQLFLSVSKRFPRYWVGAFIRYDTLEGARFRDSPLVRQHDALAAGLGISWVFGQSARQVDAID